jgi:hypothetical protein
MAKKKTAKKNVEAAESGKREPMNMNNPNGIELRLDLKPTIDGRDGQHFTMARSVEGPSPESFTMGGRVIVNGKDTFIEVEPQEDWFEIRSMRGVQKLYLKFQRTGLETIYYGPYDTKEEGLLALHRVLDQTQEAMSNAGGW